MIEPLKGRYVVINPINKDLEIVMGEIVDKLNEVAEAHNKLEAEYKAHRHEQSRSTSKLMPTPRTTPPVEAPDDQL